MKPTCQLYAQTSHFDPYMDLGPIRGCQLTEARRTPIFGVQVMKINADLLHFQPTPSALESIIGGVELTGSKAVAQTTAKKAPTKNFHVMFVIPCSYAYGLGFCGTD